MTNSEILIKAIEKAVNNGFNPSVKGRMVMKSNCWWKEWDCEDEYGEPYIAEYPYCPSVPELCFNHDFAKAFWGEEKEKYAVGSKGFQTYIGSSQGWQYHLQSMVLEEDPVKYLEQFLDDK